MSDENIVHDWIDADKLRKTAEGLLKPAPELSQKEKDAAAYGKNFVGFAEVKKSETSSAAGNAQNLEKARENLSKAQDTAAGAGIISSSSASPEKPKAVATTPPQAKAVSNVSLPPVTPKTEAGGAQPVLPVVKPASVSPSPEPVKTAATPAQPVSVKPTSIQTPFKIVTESISKEELAKLPRSV